MSEEMTVSGVISRVLCITGIIPDGTGGGKPLFFVGLFRSAVSEQCGKLLAE